VSIFKSQERCVLKIEFLIASKTSLNFSEDKV
jgi:hypothetical protein